MNKLKILVADSHEVVRLGISFILKCAEDMVVVAEAGICNEVLQKTAAYNPEIIIMDYRLNEGCAIDVCRQIKEKYPHIKVIMFISPSDDESIFEAISAGVDGLLPKQIKSEELTNAIKMVREGNSMLDPAIISKVMSRVKSGFTQPERKDAVLNPQERRILALIAEGKTNKEIAMNLMLSNNTIKNYVSGILSKLNFSNRAEAAAYAVRNNLLMKPRAVGGSQRS